MLGRLVVVVKWKQGDQVRDYCNTGRDGCLFYGGSSKKDEEWIWSVF